MQNIFGIRLLLVAACILFGTCAWSQAHDTSIEPQRELIFTYNAMYSNRVPGQTFWLQGGGVQAAGQFTQHLAAVVEVAGVHTGKMPGSPKGLDLVTTLAGPRASVNVYGKRLRLYGELLGGVANGCNSVFPGAQSTTPDAFSLALSMGGGADYRIHKHLLVRTADLSWLRTSLSNGTTSAQNNLRISSGLVIRF